MGKRVMYGIMFTLGCLTTLIAPVAFDNLNQLLTTKTESAVEVVEWEKHYVQYLGDEFIDDYLYSGFNVTMYHGKTNGRVTELVTLKSIRFLGYIGGVWQDRLWDDQILESMIVINDTLKDFTFLSIDVWRRHSFGVSLNFVNYDMIEFPTIQAYRFR